MEIKLNQKYYYLNHYVIVKAKGTKFRWLLLDEKHAVIRKSVNESVTAEEAYHDATSTVLEEVG